MLELIDVHAYYGKSHVLQGVNLSVREGEVVALLGRNGAGRSTLMKTVMGEVAPRGQVMFDGQDIAGWPTHRIARAGLGYVAESRDVFAALSVHENLRLGQLQATSERDRWTRAALLERFPNLAARLSSPAGTLSGGEQQMLAMARALLGQPRLMLVDEPTEGLAPLIVILLVEQKLDIALDVADRIYVMGHGEIVFEGSPAAFAAAADVRQAWLEV